MYVNSFTSIFTNICRGKDEEEPEEQMLNPEDTARQYENDEVGEMLILNPADTARQIWLKNDNGINQNEHGALLNVRERNSQTSKEQTGYTPLNRHTMMVR